MTRKSLLVLTGVMALAWSSQVLAADTPKSLVEYRQAVMKSLGAHASAIGMIVKGEVGYTAQVREHAIAIKEMSLIVPDIFPANSSYDDYDKTKALPEIWKEPAKFKAVVEAFQVAASEFAAVAAGGDMGATTDSFLELGKACGACHKPFRYKE